MKRRTILLAVLLALLMGLSVPASAALSAGQKLAAEALIKQFSHRDFAVREQAVTRLVALGVDVVPVVKKALAETTDNEVKLRCEMVLKAIAKKHGIDVGLGTKRPARDWGLDASKVTLKAQGADLDAVIETLAEQSGNTLVRLPEAWAGQPLILQVTDMPYWQALDQLCAQAKLIYTADYQNGGLKLTAVEDAIQDISAYAGPTVLKLTSATRMRSFRGAAAPMRGMQNSLNYRFSFYWEDRLQPIRSEVSFTSAKAPDGTELKLNQTPVRAFTGAWGGGRGRQRTAAGQAYTTITEVPEHLEKVAELHGVVKFTLGDGEKSLKIENALAEGEKSGTLDDTTLTVTNVNRRNTWTQLSVKMTVDGKEAAIQRYPYGSPYGFFLIDPNGEKHRGTSFGGYRRVINAQQPGGNRGNRRRRGRDRGDGAAPQAPAEKVKKEAAAPAAVGHVQVVVLGDAGGVMAKEGGADVEIVVAQAGGQRPGGRRRQGNAAPGVMRAGGTSVSFTRLPEIEGAWALVFVMPAQSTEKEFPFTFKDVPLP